MNWENILNTPLPTLLVVAGFIFLLLSIATIKRPIVIDITDTGRKVAGVIGGLLLATGILLFVNIPITATRLPTGPHLEVQSLYEAFDKSVDHPLRYINIPRHIITTGKANSVLGKELHVWIAVCPQTAQSCAIKELKLDESGEWIAAIDIGAQEDDCGRFDVSFVVISNELNNIFSVRRQTGILKDEIESFDYKDKDVYTVLRGLNEDLLPISCP